MCSNEEAHQIVVFRNPISFIEVERLGRVFDHGSLQCVASNYDPGKGEIHLWLFNGVYGLLAVGQFTVKKMFVSVSDRLGQIMLG